MSRIGKKPIAIPKGVTVKIEGNTVLVQGPKGKLDTPLPSGIKMEQKDGHLVALRENDSQAAVHGLARALVNNAVDGVTKGWTRDLEIVVSATAPNSRARGLWYSTWATRIRSNIRCRRASNARWTRSRPG